MLREEIRSSLLTMRTKLFILVIICIPLFDLYFVAKQEHVSYKQAHKEEILEADAILKENSEKTGAHYVSSWIIPPAKASYLSGSSSAMGHLTQTLLIWYMPLFLLNIVGDRTILEDRKRYTNALLMRASRKRYLISKLVSAFLLSGSVYAVSLLINFVAAQIVFRGGTNFWGIEVWAEEGGWFLFEYTHPNRAYLLYMAMAVLAAGMCGVICQSLALLTKRYTVTYLIAFFVWMELVRMKHSIIYMFQPFTEFGMDAAIRPGVILVIIAAVLVIAAVVVRMRRDEL